MRRISIAVLGLVVVACSPAHKFTIVDQLCDGGTQTYSIPGQQTDNTVHTREPCGDLTVQNNECDGGMMSYTVPASDGGTVVVTQECSCVPETEAQSCTRLNACGLVDGYDNCGALVRLNCPPCPDGGEVGPASVVILEAPCGPADSGPAADAGIPVAVFTIPTSFDPERGDSIQATSCASMCADAGQVCEIASIFQGVDSNGVIPKAGGSVQVWCGLNAPIAGLPRCDGDVAFLRVTE